MSDEGQRGKRSRSEFDSGVKEGKIDAHLQEHDRRLDAINGNIAKFTTSVRELATTVRKGLDGLASEIRTLQEEGRLAERERTSREQTLAKETERRREELALTATALSAQESTSDRKFSKRERLVALAVTVALGLISLYLATK